MSPSPEQPGSKQPVPPALLRLFHAALKHVWRLVRVKCSVAKGARLTLNARRETNVALKNSSLHFHPGENATLLSGN